MAEPPSGCLGLEMGGLGVTDGDDIGADLNDAVRGWASARPAGRGLGSDGGIGEDGLGPDGGRAAEAC